MDIPAGMEPIAIIVFGVAIGSAILGFLGDLIPRGINAIDPKRRRRGDRHQPR